MPGDDASTQCVAFYLNGSSQSRYTSVFLLEILFSRQKASVGTMKQATDRFSQQTMRVMKKTEKVQHQGEDAKAFRGGR